MSLGSLSSATRPPLFGLVDLALLSVRIGLAGVFIFHGGQKLFGLFGGQGMAQLVQGFGPVLGYLIAIGEFFGGLGLLVGFLSRFSAASLVVIMAGAIALVHGKNGFSLANSGYEYNFTLITMALAILLAGPGRIAVTQLLPPGVRRFLG
jgi:putative oxidoreductase